MVMRRTKRMKMAGILLLILALVLASGCKCGKDAAEKQEEASASMDTARDSSESIDSEDTASEDENTAAEDIASEDTGSDNTASEDAEDENAPSVTADRAMLETANTNIQTYSGTMAFGEEYIYFTANDKRYRCRYDGSDMQKLDKALENVVFAEGKLWGYYGDLLHGDPYGIYCMEPETGETAVEQEFSYEEQSVSSILVSGSWMCYAGEDGSALVIRDLSTGKEKTLIHSINYGEYSDIAMCLYGNTLYALISTGKEEGSYICSLCTYELGSDAETMTELCSDLNPGGKIRTAIWMEDGILLFDKSEGSQYYYAKFADIKNGSWEYRSDKNKIGTDLSGTFVGSQLGSGTCARYVLGNDLLLITSDSVNYIKDFDLTKTQRLDVMEDHSFIPKSGIERSHGMHDGCVYIYTQDELTEDYIIVKISEGGTVEYIPVSRPMP